MLRKMFGEKKVVRHKSVERILDEIEDVRTKYRIRRITFQDDVFVASLPWVEEFSKKYPKRIGIPFSIFARAEMINEDVARQLALAGGRTAIMAIERGGERIGR